jgi:hypothetical protein
MLPLSTTIIFYIPALHMKIISLFVCVCVCVCFPFARPCVIYSHQDEFRDTSQMLLNFCVPYQ